MADEQTAVDPALVTDGAADDVRARSVQAAADAEAMTPTPTQEEIDRIKAGAPLETKGGYKTRQARAG